MARIEADYVDEWLGKLIQKAIETHDDSEDGDSTGGAISILERIRAQINTGIALKGRRDYLISQIEYIGARVTAESDVDDAISDLAASINAWS